MSPIKALRTQLPAGGGTFELGELTIGIFLNDQPTHRLSLGSDKRTMRPLKAHEGWVLPQNAQGLCRFDDPLEVLMVGIDAKILAEAGLSDPETIEPIVGAIDPLLVQMAVNAPALDTAGALYRDTMHQALAAHLTQLIHPTPSAVAGLSDQRLARAVSYIHDNLAQDLRLDDMAQEAAMSPYHFARAFKAETGQSPLQYVIATRIEAAKVLLKTTRLPVAEIAHRVGYADLSHFGRHFKARIGVTPKSYRDG